MDKIKILMISSPFFPIYSGAAKQLFNLASQLISYENIKIKILSSGSNVRPMADFPILNLCDYKKGWYSKYVFVLKAFLYCLFNPTDFDILHINGAYWSRMFPLIAAKIWSKKIIIKLTLFGSDDPISMGKQKFGWVKQLLFSLSDSYVCVSRQLEESCKSYFKNLSKNILYIPNGVDLRLYKPVKKQDKNLLRMELGIATFENIAIFAGRIESRKGIYELLKVWQYIIRYKELKLLIIGPKNEKYYHHLQDYIANTDLHSYISFIGHTSEILKYYQIADIFVFCSSEEGLPNSLLEAMACALPIVTFDISPLRDIVDKKFRIKDRNIKEMGNLILNIFNNPGEMIKIGISNRQFITKNYSIKKVSKQYVDLYYSL